METNADIKKIEEMRREIEDYHKTLSIRRKMPLKKFDNEEYIAKTEEKLKSTQNDFDNYMNYLLATNKTPIEDWVLKHKNTIQKVINFSENHLKQSIVYEPYFIENRNRIFHSWNNFMRIFKIPRTFMIENYNMFYDLLDSEYKNAMGSEPNEEESSILKQLYDIWGNIVDLTRENFKNDVILDKGQAWGFSPEDEDKAQEGYVKIQNEIENIKKKYIELVYNLQNNNRNAYDKWILWHLYTCIAIVDFSASVEDSSFTKDSVRIQEAKATFYQWLEVNENNENIIIPNIYYLIDYPNVMWNIIIK